MNRQEARRRIEEYFRGWKERDVDRLVSVLSDDVVVVESDGSTTRGIGGIRRWFTDWHAEPINGSVTAWEIRGVVFDDTGRVATAPPPRNRESPFVPIGPNIIRWSSCHPSFLSA